MDTARKTDTNEQIREDASREGPARSRKMFQGDRDYSVDVVRCVSCFMVIAGHVFWFVSSSSGYTDMESGTLPYYLAVFLRSTFTCGTDIFLMVSGIFFLSPERNVTARKIYGKNIMKMGCAYVLWMILYAWADCLYAMEPFNFIDVLYDAVHRPQNHLWYIPMMIGVYMMVPLLRVFTKGAKRFHYRYLYAAVIGASIMNTVVVCNRYFPFPGSEVVNTFITRAPVGLFSNYFMLAVIGYYLYTYNIKRSARFLLYIFGLAGIVSMSIMIIVKYHIDFMPDTPDFYGKFVSGNILKCSAIFVLITTLFENVRFGKFAKKVLLKLSNATLFIYLYHWMVIEYMTRHAWLMHGSLEGHYILIGFIYAIVTYVMGFLFQLLFLQTIPWKKIRNRILDRFWPNRTIYVTKKEPVRTRRSRRSDQVR